MASKGTPSKRVYSFKFYPKDQDETVTFWQRLWGSVSNHPWRTFFGVLLAVAAVVLLFTPPGQALLLSMMGLVASEAFITAATATLAPFAELALGWVISLGIAAGLLGTVLLKGIGETLQFVGKWLLEIPSRLILFPADDDGDESRMHYTAIRGFFSIPGMILNLLGRAINTLGEKIAGVQRKSTDELVSESSIPEPRVLVPLNKLFVDVGFPADSHLEDRRVISCLDEVAVWKESIKLSMSARNSYYFSQAKQPVFCGGPLTVEPPSKRDSDLASEADNALRGYDPPTIGCC